MKLQACVALALSVMACGPEEEPEPYEPEGLYLAPPADQSVRIDLQTPLGQTAVYTQTSGVALEGYVRDWEAVYMIETSGLNCSPSFTLNNLHPLAGLALVDGGPVRATDDIAYVVGDLNGGRAANFFEYVKGGLWHLTVGDDAALIEVTDGTHCIPGDEPETADCGPQPAPLRLRLSGGLIADPRFNDTIVTPAEWTHEPGNGLPLCQGVVRW